MKTQERCAFGSLAGARCERVAVRRSPPSTMGWCEEHDPNACGPRLRRRDPTREEMTLLWGNDTRELRAAIVDGRLVILAYDRYDEREAGPDDWSPDPEAGVFLPPEGLHVLREMLAPPDGQDVGKVGP